jgi:hypothetical protein
VPHEFGLVSSAQTFCGHVCEPEPHVYVHWFCAQTALPRTGATQLWQAPPGTPFPHSDSDWAGTHPPVPQQPPGQDVPSHGVHAPALQIRPAPHAVPSATFPTAVHFGVPVLQS